MDLNYQPNQQVIYGYLHQVLENYRSQIPCLLFEAMSYALLAPSKRLRSYLMFQVADLLNISNEQILPIALSLECVHCYSLVHDDLPCMDDGDLRHGQPTVHKRYDDATALLVGNSLMTLALQILLQANTLNPESRCQLALLLCDASGAKGMMAGQLLDLQGEQKSFDLNDIETMQLLKTGALLHFALIAPTVLKAVPKDHYQALVDYGRAISIAYQISDDILDINSHAKIIGKSTGQDVLKGKSTFISLLGLTAAQQKMADYINQAHNALDIFGDKKQPLHDFATMILNRRV